MFLQWKHNFSQWKTTNYLFESERVNILTLPCARIGVLYRHKGIFLSPRCFLTLYSIDIHSDAPDNRQLWETLWEKEKLLVTSNFSFPNNVFYSVRLYPQLSILLTSYLCLLLSQIVSLFVNIFDVISLFAVELEEPRMGTWGKGLM